MKESLWKSKDQHLKIWIINGAKARDNRKYISFRRMKEMNGSTICKRVIAIAIKEEAGDHLWKLNENLYTYRAYFQVQFYQKYKWKSSKWILTVEALADQ